MAFQEIDIEGQNKLVKQWTSKVRRKLKGRLGRFSDGKESMVIRSHGQTEKKLQSSLKSQFGKDFGVIERVRFSFERHGVFVHKGVGRGYKMNGGMVTRTAKGPQTAPRKPDEWFNPILEKTLPELANRLAELNADAVINAERMKIK
jgi:hypothetical protein